jgi:hypothetical protein
VSIRRACSVLKAERSSYHYKGKRRPQAVLSKRIKEIAETRVRYGYRRIPVLLRREGWQVNAKRVWRLYREMGLQLRNKAPKRRVKAKLREGRSGALGPNDVWAMDFVHDQLFDGRKIRALTIVDTFTRLSRAIDVRQSYRGPTWSQRWSAPRSKRVCRRRSVSTMAGVRQQGTGSMGFHTRRHTRLLPTRQTNRQRLHRVVQREVPRRVPKRQLVSQSRRGAAKMRGLA